MTGEYDSAALRAGLDFVSLPNLAATEEGRRAFNAGHTLKANPYGLHENFGARCCWITGWRSASESSANGSPKP